MAVIFLDFDGVLRRNGSPLYTLESELVNNLQKSLRATPTVKIVITSSWREAFGLNEMRSLFSADIASRVEGCTPTSLDLDGFYRHREVLAYLKRFHTLQTPWIAVDDDPEHFPSDAPVLLIDPSRGLDEEATHELTRQLIDLTSRPGN